MLVNSNHTVPLQSGRGQNEHLGFPGPEYLPLLCWTFRHLFSPTQPLLSLPGKPLALACLVHRAIHVCLLHTLRVPSLLPARVSHRDPFPSSCWAGAHLHFTHQPHLVNFLQLIQCSASGSGWHLHPSLSGAQKGCGVAASPLRSPT